MTAIEISEFLGLSELVESRGAIKIQGKTRNRLSKVRSNFTYTGIELFWEFDYCLRFSKKYLLLLIYFH